VNTFDPQNIIESIKKEDRTVLLEIYRDHFPQARHYILLNSGNKFDAEDIFQDAMVLIYIKIRSNTFKLTSSFGTYLHSVVRFLWLKELERKKRYFSNSLEINDPILSDVDLIEDYIKLERRKLIIDHYLGLNEECKKLLELYFNETPISRITALMAYSNDQYTKNRRSACKERLIRSIWNNPRFKELKNETYRQDTEVPRW